MIARVFFFVSIAAVLSQVISAAILERTAMSKVLDFVIDARKTASAKSEEARVALQKLNNAIKNYDKAQSDYFQAASNRTLLDTKQKDLNDRINVAKDNFTTATTKLDDAAKAAATAALTNLEVEKSELEMKIPNAIEAVKTSENNYVNATQEVQKLKKEYDDLKTAATVAEAQALQSEAAAETTRLISSLAALLADTKKDPTPTPVTLKPDQNSIFSKIFEKINTKTVARRPSIIGTIIRGWAKINLEIADSLDQMKASIRSMFRPGANRNPQN